MVGLIQLFPYELASALYPAFKCVFLPIGHIIIAVRTFPLALILHIFRLTLIEFDYNILGLACVFSE